ncbi:MAG: hypothetical protein ACRDZQ_13305, partial [Acidimicrobiales bacterium]
MTAPSFVAFYGAVNGGRRPFPWQERLAEQVVEGGWPTDIGVPTGLGKTSCLDVAVWALAAERCASIGTDRQSIRIWYVVNRRLLVDAAADHGALLAELLAHPEKARASDSGVGKEEVEALREVSASLGALSALGVSGGPLQVTRLRGGAELGARPVDPSQPALVFATVPMFASRLLLRGYGSSAGMRPVDAALAGIDSLVLLDEAHLARPLRRLVEACAEADLGDPSQVLAGERSRPRVVALTATGEDRGQRFDLDEVDRDHPVVARRLSATKPTTLVPTEKKKLARAVATAAADLLDRRPGSAVVAFCNTVRLARDVESALQQEKKRDRRPFEVVLVTGRMRDREGDAVRAGLLDPASGASAGRQLSPAGGVGLVVVATQTLEVGADLDFDFLVTETASVRALTQRFGRLNRLGLRPHAAAVICHPVDTTS